MFILSVNILKQTFYYFGKGEITYRTASIPYLFSPEMIYFLEHFRFRPDTTDHVTRDARWICLVNHPLFNSFHIHLCFTIHILPATRFLSIQFLMFAFNVNDEKVYILSFICKCYVSELLESRAISFIASAVWFFMFLII